MNIWAIIIIIINYKTVRTANYQSFTEKPVFSFNSTKKQYNY